MDDEDIEKLMKIDVYKNETNTFYEFERNKYIKDETDNIVTPNISWFLLKPSITDEKMNKYKLSPGEIIKLGRITMRVRDIIFAGKNKYNLNDSSLLNESMLSKINNNEMQTLKTEVGTISYLLNRKMKNKKFRNKNKNIENFDTKLDKGSLVNIIKKPDLKKNLNLYSKIEKKNKTCRICYIQEDDEENNPLVQPCNCDGSLKYIHLQCLSQWIQTHSCEKLETNNNCSIYLIKPVECELCKKKFPDYIKYKNKFFPLISFANEYNSYLTLESLTLDKYHNKFIYVISLENNRKISIGKNQNCQIILSDRSIENIHCFMIVSNKQVYLEDSDSKFGTLVLVQTNKIKLYQDIPLYLQIGRSFLEILIKKEFKFFDCCVSDEKNNIYTYYEQNEKYIKKDMSLVVKNEDEESESYNKDNYTQEIKLYNYNNSLNFEHQDKMSESEYLQIKRNKRNKEFKKNIYSEVTYEQKEEEKKKNIFNEEEKKEDDNIQNDIQKQQDKTSEGIKIESEDSDVENFRNEINNEIINQDIINEENNNEIKEDKGDEYNLIEEIQSINGVNKDEDINEIVSNNSNIEIERNQNVNEEEENNNINKEIEAIELNESNKNERKENNSFIEI